MNSTLTRRLGATATALVAAVAGLVAASPSAAMANSSFYLPGTDGSASGTVIWPSSRYKGELDAYIYRGGSAEVKIVACWQFFNTDTWWVTAGSCQTAYAGSPETSKHVHLYKTYNNARIEKMTVQLFIAGIATEAPRDYYR